MKPIKWHLWKLKYNTISRLLQLRYMLHYKSWWKSLYDNSSFDGVNYKGRDAWRDKARAEVRAQAITILKDTLKGKTVFEFGAGRGYFSNLMKKWGYSVFATDLVAGNIRYDITSNPLPMKYDNVVGMGVLHHIMNDKKFIRALKNIKAMARNNIIMGVKIGNRPGGIGIKQRPISEYETILGPPIEIRDAGYLTILIFKVGVNTNADLSPTLGKPATTRTREVAGASKKKKEPGCPLEKPSEPSFSRYFPPTGGGQEDAPKTIEEKINDGDILGS